MLLWIGLSLKSEVVKSIFLDHYVDVVLVSVEGVNWHYHKDNLDKIETIPDELFKM